MNLENKTANLLSLLIRIMMGWWTSGPELNGAEIKLLAMCLSTRSFWWETKSQTMVQSEEVILVKNWTLVSVHVYWETCLEPLRSNKVMELKQATIIIQKMSHRSPGWEGTTIFTDIWSDDKRESTGKNKWWRFFSERMQEDRKHAT